MNISLILCIWKTCPCMPCFEIVSLQILLLVQVSNLSWTSKSFEFCTSFIRLIYIWLMYIYFQLHIHREVQPMHICQRTMWKWCLVCDISIFYFSFKSFITVGQLLGIIWKDIDEKRVFKSSFNNTIDLFRKELTIGTFWCCKSQF